ncbi:MAG: ABC transporter ATP-binding protein/permease [Clostridiales bacterium]|nr:ABC transporter ATP-binding protein/permease [Clostridiales bacterium]
MLRIFKNLDKKDWLLVILAIALVFCQVWLDLKLPDYMSQITVLVETEGSAMSEVLTAGGKMLLCALGSLLTAACTAVVAARIASDFSADLRLKLFDRVQAFSMEEIGRFSTASLITRSTNDITQVQMLIVMGVQAIIRAPIMAVWAGIKIAGKGFAWTMATVVAIIVLLGVVVICVSIAMPKFRRLQMLVDDVNRVTRENLTGLSVVRAYNAENVQEKKFDDANNELTKTNLGAMRVMAFMRPTITAVMSGLTLAIYWIGAVIINQAELTDKMTLFSNMVVFSSYAMQMVMAFMMLIMVFIMLPRASVSARRIMQVLDTEPTIVDGAGAKPAAGCVGEVEFRNVCFRYPDSDRSGDHGQADENVLHNISFSAHKGETVALIGATGCGKSTVINLVPRFYDATEGEVLVDGVNVKDYTQYDLHNKIGYISQKALLFTGTVKSNIAFGDNGKNQMLDEDVVSAVNTAQAAEFVEKLEDGYDGYVAQGGSNFSGGQKQRLSIARAICRKPEILIFDDSFSALDYRTDRVLRDALKRDCADATKIIVAQRIGTIRNADRIIVLEDGKIAGIGTHNELMKNCEVYQQIAYSQLSKEELA